MSRAKRETADSGAGIAIGRTRPLWMAVNCHPSILRTATMVSRVNRRSGSSVRHATRTEPVPYSSATSWLG